MNPPKVSTPGTSSILEFRIFGMDCAEEIAALKREVLPIVGSSASVSFDLLNGKMVIKAVGQLPPSSVFISAIKKAGMKAETWGNTTKVPVNRFDRSLRIISTTISGIAILAGFSFHALSSGSFLAAFGAETAEGQHALPIISKALYLLASIAGAWSVAPKAFLSLRRLRPDMNLLMTVAVLGALLIGEWFEAATVTFLFSISLMLESWSVERARGAIQSLMGLAPTIVHLKTESGEIKDSDPAAVTVGSIMLVRPGEKIALDGKVISGSSSVNQASITGESIPVSKEVDSNVFAGTINGDGSLEVQITKVASDTTLSHIIRLVEEAQSKKAESEQWVEKFARIYTPIILLLASLFLLVPPMLFHSNWGEWIYRALVLLVIACPCALVISTPVSIVSSIAAAAKNGVLIKGGTYIEIPSQIKAFALDKTGTITEGKPKVVDVVPLSGHNESELMELAYSMEFHSDHPLGRAIRGFAELQSIKPVKLTNFQTVQGKGATAIINGESYWLGSHRYLEEKGQETSEIHEQLNRLSASGKSVVVIGNQKHVCGFITLADTVRENAKIVIENLRKERVQKIFMLTGDNRPTAESIGLQTGVDEVLSELLPADKVRSIENLLGRFEKVAMVGDGINDAPALARASLGIAMGAAGSDAALETADIALMSDDLSKLPWLIKHSRRTMRVIRQNIFSSLMVKAIFVALTIWGYSSLWSAIAADMGVSLAVVFNGMRLLSPRFRK